MNNDDFVIDVTSGLSAYPKFIPSKYFYDSVGSEIFRNIMKAEEYYLTSSEQEIISDYSDELPEFLNDKINLIELGAGDGSKTVDLINTLLSKQIDLEYHAFDISKGALDLLSKKINSRFPNLEAYYSMIDFEKGLQLLATDKTRQNVIIFLGSSIGNLTPKESIQFLKTLSQKLNPGDFWLIGFDLIKDITIMEQAYNDSMGLTKEFNLNLLHRINRELGANFDLDSFKHVEFYDTKLESMVSFLRSTRYQKVYLGGINKFFEIQKGEDIRTEFSFKYNQAKIEYIVNQAKLKIRWQAYDSKKYYTLAMLEV